jgi:hypothetical protein
LKTTLCTALAATLLTLTLGSPSEAACTSGGHSQGLPSLTTLFAPSTSGGSAASLTATTGAGASIVGLWHVTFLLGDGPTLYDEAYELWHADGTELAIDNAVPPSLGNVCIGVWRQEGRAIKLTHVTWNWNLDGTRAGRFVLTETVSVGAKGDTFSGTYVTDSYDLDEQVIPELHAEGTVSGTRITP